MMLLDRVRVLGTEAFALYEALRPALGGREGSCQIPGKSGGMRNWE